MKKNYSLILLAFILFACSKSDVIKEPLPLKESFQEIRTASREGDIESQIQMFNLLTAEERYELWQNYLANVEIYYDTTDNDEKEALIEDVLENLNPSVFEDSSYEADIFTEYFLPTWEENARSIFSDVELYNIAFNPFSESVISPVVISYEEATPEKCWCHSGQQGFSCTKTKLIFSDDGISYTREEGVCYRGGSDCEGSKRGCGWFWLSSCGGNACQF